MPWWRLHLMSLWSTERKHGTYELFWTYSIQRLMKSWFRAPVTEYSTPSPSSLSLLSTEFLTSIYCMYSCFPVFYTQCIHGIKYKGTLFLAVRLTEAQFKVKSCIIHCYWDRLCFPQCIKCNPDIQYIAIVQTCRHFKDDNWWDEREGKMKRSPWFDMIWSYHPFSVFLQ